MQQNTTMWKEKTQGIGGSIAPQSMRLPYRPLLYTSYNYISIGKWWLYDTYINLYASPSSDSIILNIF